MGLTIKSPKSITDLRGATYNPRVITPKQLAALKRSIEQFGDLSGVVFNATSGVLVSGHQRLKTIKGKPTKIVKTAQKKDTQGTVAIGHIAVTEADGAVTKIPYREVQWDDKLTEMAANVAANAAGGEFDQAKLGSILAKLEKSKFDIELTSVDTFDLTKAIGKFKKSANENSDDGSTGDSSKFEVVDPTSIKFEHKCPKCGYQFDSKSAGKTKTPASKNSVQVGPKKKPKAKTKAK
jgi:hypothetical protein